MKTETHLRSIRATLLTIVTLILLAFIGLGVFVLNRHVTKTAHLENELSRTMSHAPYGMHPVAAQPPVVTIIAPKVDLMQRMGFSDAQIATINAEQAALAHR